MITYADPAELPESATHDTPDKHRAEGWCETCEEVHDLVCPKCHGESVQIDAHGFKHADVALVTARWRQLLMHAQGQKNSKYFIGCILMATGDTAAEGVSMSDYARHWGKTKADVSKNCVAICAYLGVEPSQNMRDTASKESFRNRNTRPTKLCQTK